MKKYIGFKMVDAKPRNLREYCEFIKAPIPEGDNPEREGYLVCYSDEYMSWSPKDVFEKAYFEVSPNNTITQANIDSFIKNVDVKTIGEKTTFVHVTLINGFELTESSSCVDPANYDEKMGAEICLERIKNKMWELLGFLLQTAKNGVK
jgi:hypothetical protein